MKPNELTEQRERLGLTKAELARELRVEWQTVHRWETGIRTIPDTVEAFLELLLVVYNTDEGKQGRKYQRIQEWFLKKRPPAKGRSICRKAYEGETKMPVKMNDKVICNGFPGTIVEVCTGKLSGMVVVRLERGDVCVGISDLGK